MHTLPLVAYVLAGLGVLLGGGFAGLVVYDVHLATTGQETISEWFAHAKHWQRGVVLLLGFLFAFMWGGLIGHLVWTVHDSNAFWFDALGMVFIGLIVGVCFGHRFFAQTL